ncbi:MAG: hypothetical protein ABSA01_09775 [Anaerolineales bacterium]
MVLKPRFKSIPYLDFYRLFLGLAILEGFLAFWFIFRVPSKVGRVFLAGYSRLRIGIGAAALFVLAVLILLLLDSFLSQRFPKFLASWPASILSKDVNRTIIKTSFAIVLIISLVLAEEFNLPNFNFKGLGVNTLSIIGLFIGWFFLMSIKTFILYSLWQRKVNQSLSAPIKLVPVYYKDALIILCLLAFVFAYLYQDGGFNGNSRFDLIFAIVKEGRLTIDTFQGQADTFTSDKAYFNGHFYSDKAIGPALIGTIVYAPFYWLKQIFDFGSQAETEVVITYLVIGIPSAIGGSLMYILCWYLSRSRFRAYLVTLTVTLGTMYFPYSITFFSHQFTSSLLFGAFFLIFFLKQRPEIWKKWPSFLIGWLLGWAMISDFQSVIIIFVLVSYYFFILWRNREYWHFRLIVLPMLGGLIPVLLQLVYNKLCFGNFFTLGYANESDQIFNSGMAQGIMGIHWPSLSALYYMTLHPAMGLFWESPALLFSIVGLVLMLLKRRYLAEAFLAMGIIVSYLVIMSGYYMWWGGYAVGPRFIIPMLPFFCIFLIFIPKRLTWPFVVLSLISFGQMLLAAASTVQVPDTMVSKLGKLGFFEYTNIYSYCLKQLENGKFTQNLGHRLLGLESWNSLIPLLVVIGAVTLFFFWEKVEISHNRNFQL